MSATFYDCCTELVGRWERLLGPEGSCEIDAQIELQNLTKDIISRTAFGSSFEKGRRIFELLEEQTELAARLFMYWQIPAYRYIPTKKNRRMKEVYREVHEILRNMIIERQKAVRSGVASNDDLLGLLLESNLSYSSEKGELKRSGMTTERGFGMTTEDMIEECKLFYFAGQETTSDLLTWTMVALSMHPEWQERARAEVLQVFGKNRPEYDGLSQLTTVTMILYEVLRLYPPSVLLTRNADGAVTLGGYNFPSGTQFVIHVLFPHHDPELWGSDANEFKPERFAEGVSGASKGPVTAFLPFGGGARICVGQSFALMEARMCLCAILQNFSFELSPAYKHAPHLVITLHAQHGVQIVLRKL